MPRKKLVYLQLYTKDFTGDERLRMCSPSAWGIYSYLLHLLNEAQIRGAYKMSLLERRPNLKKSLTQQILHASNDTELLAPFAEILLRQMPWKKMEILRALKELYFFGVIKVEGDMLIQPRMYREGKSEEQGVDEGNAIDISTSHNNDIATEESTPTKKSSQKKNPKAKQFIPPTLDEVKAYFEEKGTAISPDAFFAHYEANGWVQAKGKPIKNWKACLTTWEHRQSEFESGKHSDGKNATRKNPTIISSSEIDYDKITGW